MTVTDGEVVNEVSVAGGGLRTMAVVLRSHLRPFLVACACGVANQGLQIAATVLGAYLVSAAVFGADQRQLWLLAGVVLGLVALRGLASWWEAYVSHALAFYVLAQVRGWIYRAFVRMAPGKLLRRRSGDLVTRTMTDSEGLEMFYAHTLIYLVVAVVLTPLPLVALAVLHPGLALAAAVPVALLCSVPFALRRHNSRHGAAVRAQVAEVGNQVGEPAQVRAALTAAAVSEVVDRLPDGTATQVGERGARLSGGERQRLAVARTLLRDAPVLVLDEPVSQLDTISEQRLREALDAARTGRTVIVVAHRLSTILAADRVVVLDRGRVVGDGSHAGLLHDCPEYARLVAAQWSLQLRTGG